MITVNNKQYMGTIPGIRLALYDKANELNFKITDISLIQFRQDGENKYKVKIHFKPNENTYSLYWGDWYEYEVGFNINNLEKLFKLN